MASMKKNAKKETADPAETEGLPLFFKKPAALDKNRHAKAGIKPTATLAFAARTNSLPLNTIEFLEAVKYYPIVFTNDEQAAPVAIVGMEKTNYFVNRDGQWKEGSYIPAYVRQYPFIFFQPPEGDMYYLCVDEASDAFVADTGKKGATFFEKDGEPSPLSRNALQFCTAFYQQLSITRNFCADLVKHNLLTPYHSKMTTKSGKELSLSGFRMIDEKAFNALSDEVFKEFRSKGWLPFIYFALASASNWKQLLNLANTAE